MKITVTKDFRNLKAGSVYDFSLIKELGFITIVGDNGSGKSSLIHALRGYKNDAKTESLYERDFVSLASNIKVEHDYEKIFFLDSIKDNGNDMNVAYDAVNYISSGGFGTKNLSHGQSSVAYLGMFLEKHIKLVAPGKTLLVFDEIDNGFSLKNMARFINFVGGATEKYKCHVLIISHNPFLIRQSILCYDINKREIVSSKDYLLKETGYELNEIKQ